MCCCRLHPCVCVCVCVEIRCVNSLLLSCFCICIRTLLAKQREKGAIELLGPLLVFVLYLGEASAHEAFALQ